MSNSLKLSTALPGDDEINGLDVLAEPIVTMTATDTLGEPS